jgi:DNA-binding NarL/FixJ family response regulator
MANKIRIGLLDTDTDVRFGRKLLFSSLSNAEVVFESSGELSDLESIRESLIDVLVIDQKLASGPGVDFYSSLRELTGIKEAPPAIVTTSYGQPALLIEALEVGVFDVVAVEQGAEALVQAVTKARSSANAYSLADLKRLLASQPRVRAVDLNFVSLVDQLPEKLAGNLGQLKSFWQKAEMDKLEKYDWKALKEIAELLPVASSSELVLALDRSGLLDD